MLATMRLSSVHGCCDSTGRGSSPQMYSTRLYIGQRVDKPSHFSKQCRPKKCPQRLSCTLAPLPSWQMAHFASLPKMWVPSSSSSMRLQ
jgi:hypothetical protein